MSLSPLPEESLYQLTQQQTLSAPTLLVTLEILQGIIASLGEFLMEQQVEAVLWLKLPEMEENWQPWETYLAQDFSTKLYGFSLSDDEQQRLQKIALTSSSSTTQTTSVIPLEFEPGHELGKEYFVVVLSSRFVSLLLAHPHESSQPSSPDPALFPAPTYHLLYSFQPPLIEQVLTQMQQALAVGDQTPVELLMGALPSVPDPHPLDSELLQHLLIKQLRGSAALSFVQTQNSKSTQVSQQLHEMLQMKDELLHNLIAELGPPLTNMKTALSLLRSPHLKREQRDRYLELLKREWERQNALVQGLLEWGKFEQSAVDLGLTALRLEEIVPSIVSTFQPLAKEKGIVLGYTIPSGCPAIACPAPWLRQIIQNLIHNSLKFTASKGRIMVQARLKDEQVKLSVMDTGIGIDQREIPHIFESFYRRGKNDANQDNSAGLGLTLVQYLLQRCGGSITVASRVGRGTTFTITLPLSQLDSQV